MGWADYFNQPSEVNSDLGNFNYQTEQDKIRRRRDLASMLLQKSGQGQQGQFVKNGDFIGYAGGNTPLSAALQGITAYMGMKGMENADKEQSTLDQRSLEALQTNIENKPWEKRLAEAQAKIDADAAKAKPEQGAWQDGGQEAQSFPVRPQPPADVRPLTPGPSAPAGPSLGSMVAGNATPATGGPSTYVGDGKFKPPTAPTPRMGAEQVKAAGMGGKLNASDISLVSSLLGGKAPASTVPAPTSPAIPSQPQPQASPLLPDMAAAAQAKQAQPQAVPQPQPMPATQAQQVPQPAQGPTMAEQMAYLQRIANSGPAGQQTAQTMMQQLMAKPQLQHVSVKNEDGSESIVAFDPSGRVKPQLVYQPEASAGPSGKQLKRDEFAGKSFENFTKAQDELNNAQQQYSKVQNARELLTRYAPSGGVFSSLYSSVAKALGNDQANALDMALKDLAFSDLRSTFGGNPTEGERKAQMEVKASIERGLAPSLAALDTLSAGVERRMRLGTQQVEYWKGMNDQYRSQPTGRAAGAGLADSLFPRR